MIANAAHPASALSAVRGKLFRRCLFEFIPQIFTRNTGRKMIPRKDFVTIPAAFGIESGIKSGFSKSAVPQVFPEMVAPAVKPCSQLPCTFERSPKPPAAPRKYPLKKAIARHIPL